MRKSVAPQIFTIESQSRGEIEEHDRRHRRAAQRLTGNLLGPRVQSEGSYGLELAFTTPIGTWLSPFSQKPLLQAGDFAQYSLPYPVEAESSNESGPADGGIHSRPLRPGRKISVPLDSSARILSAPKQNNEERMPPVEAKIPLCAIGRLPHSDRTIDDAKDRNSSLDSNGSRARICSFRSSRANGGLALSDDQPVPEPGGSRGISHAEIDRFRRRRSGKETLGIGTSSTLSQSVGSNRSQPFFD